MKMNAVLPKIRITSELMDQLKELQAYLHSYGIKKTITDLRRDAYEFLCLIVKYEGLTINLPAYHTTPTPPPQGFINTMLAKKYGSQISTKKGTAPTP